MEQKQKVQPDPKLSQQLAAQWEKRPEIRSLRQLEKLNSQFTELKSLVVKLKPNDPTSEIQAAIADLCAQTIEAISKIEAKVDLKPTFTPDIKVAAPQIPPIKIPAPQVKVEAPIVHVPAPEVNVDVPPLDVRPIIGAINELRDLFPVSDFSGLESLLKNVVSRLEEVRDRKIPVPQSPTSMTISNLPTNQAVTIADGSNIAEGATTDAAVVSDTTGTISGKLRGLVKIFADVWDSTNHFIRVSLSLTTPVFVPALTNSATQVSTTPKKLSNWSIDNPNSVYAYVQLFNVSSGGSVTLGVTTPNAVISIPPLSSTNVARMGWNFTTGIFAAATTTPTGSTALTTALNPTFGVE